MPLCAKCGKESKNLRMCPFCFSEYGLQSAPSRKSSSFLRARDARGNAIPISPKVKWGVVGLIAVFAVGYFFLGRERSIPTGVVLANVVASPMSSGEAAALVKRIKQTAKVETRGTELVVTFPEAIWPQQRAGQLAAAQQYFRAVEIVEGKRRNISFYEPSGALYAKADAAGVVMTR